MKLQPTHEDLVSHVQKTHRKATTKSGATALQMSALDLMRAQDGAEATIAEQLRDATDKENYGYIPASKPPDTVRVMMENFNSLGVFTSGKRRRRKIRRIRKLMRKYDVDVLTGCETQADWSFAKNNDKFENIFGVGQQKRSVAAHNTTERITRDQKGGTATMIVDKLASRVVNVGMDPDNLGRYCWVELAGGGKTTIMATMYMSCDPGPNTAGSTVWDQHCRYYERMGDFRPPNGNFIRTNCRSASSLESKGV